MAKFREPAAPDNEQEARQRMPEMQRGVSQLLFNYLPYRTVDWEDGLAIVQLGDVRFSSIWEEERKSTLLQEMSEAFERWVARGGRVDRAFPDPVREPNRFTVGSPESIEAGVLPAALICQSCGQLIFEKKFHKDEKLSCPNCESPRVHQIPFVFVHGCGELVPINKWMPATRKNNENSGLEKTSHPIQCPQCGKSDDLYIPGRSDRVKDMKVVCRRCSIEVLDRFTARCHRCLKRFAKEGTFSASPEGGGTIVSALAMRLARYSASDTYYPQTLSILRLDRPRLRSSDDEVSATLYKILPQSRRPDTAVSASDSIRTLSERLRIAESSGDHAERDRLLAKIAEIASGNDQTPTFVDSGLLSSISEDLEKGIKESLAFRGSVTTVPAEEKARREGGTSELLAGEVGRLKFSLGICDLRYVDDLPIITATYGYTRRHFGPTYEELGARNLPVEIRAFPPVQRTATQRLGRVDLMGTTPLLAREGEHEGIFIGLYPDRVIQWLELNGITLPDPQLPDIARILGALESIDEDRYYDTIWNLPVRRMVYGLIHSLSHTAMRAMTRYAGIDRTSVAEYIFLPLLGCVVYDSSSSFKLGGVGRWYAITWPHFFKTLPANQWSASTIQTVRITTARATVAFIRRRSPAAFSITAYLELFSSEDMRPGRMFRRIRKSSAIGKQWMRRDEGLCACGKFASLGISTS